MAWIVCAECSERFCLEDETEAVLRKSSRGFCCPWGHPLSFPKGDSKEDILRRERDRLKQQIAQKDDEIRWQSQARERADKEAEHERRRANGYKGHAAKITKRAKAGVCPCCNRHFVALERHMATKHPTFTADAPEPLRVIDGGKAA